VRMNALPGATNTTQLRNTILANNGSLNIATGISGGAHSVLSLGFNLTSDPTNSFVNQSSDKLNANPLLAPLANNGGATWTRVLLSGSSAIDAGRNFVGLQDQRGGRFLRTVEQPPANANGGDATDIGAFELPSSPDALLANGFE
jgi:hypothetical protein